MTARRIVMEFLRSKGLRNPGATADDLLSRLSAQGFMVVYNDPEVLVRAEQAVNRSEQDRYGGFK